MLLIPHLGASGGARFSARLDTSRNERATRFFIVANYCFGAGTSSVAVKKRKVTKKQCIQLCVFQKHLVQNSTVKTRHIERRNETPLCSLKPVYL